MRIDSIRIEKFKSIEDLSLDFSDMTGLWEISGCVGSGKTTICEALLYGLFGSVRDKNNRDFIKYGEKHSRIVLECFSRGHKLIIDRRINKTGQCPTQVIVDGEELKFTNKRDAQYILEREYYDVPRLTLELLCIISFNGFKSMSSLSASDARKFLDQTFGLSQIADLCDAAVEERKSVESDLTRERSEAYAISKQIEQMERLTGVEISAASESLDRLRREYDDVSNNILDLKRRREEEYNSRMDRVTSLDRELAVTKSRGQQLKKEIDFLERGVCPTCGSKLDQSHLREHLDDRSSLVDRYRELVSESESVKREFRDVLSSIDDELRLKNAQLDQLKSEGMRLSEELKIAKQMTDEKSVLEEKLCSSKDSVSILETDADQWSELVRILSGDMRSIVLREWIPMINEKIGEFLSILEQKYTAELDDSFKCTARFCCSCEEMPVSMLSTGQTKVLDMTIILAVLSVILRKVNFNICFCDELLSNMDEDLRVRMCMLLRDSIYSGNSIFLICHAPLDRSVLDGVIECTIDDGTSRYCII